MKHDEFVDYLFNRLNNSYWGIDFRHIEMKYKLLGVNKKVTADPKRPDISIKMPAGITLRGGHPIPDVLSIECKPGNDKSKLQCLDYQKFGDVLFTTPDLIFKWPGWFEEIYGKNAREFAKDYWELSIRPHRIGILVGSDSPGILWGFLSERDVLIFKLIGDDVPG